MRALVEERAGGACEVGQSLAVVGQRRDLREDRGGEVVLPGEDEEIRREADAVALLLGGELGLGGGAPRLRGVDALGGRLEREDRVPHLDGDALPLLREQDLRLGLRGLRDRDVALRRAVEDGHDQREPDRGVREAPLADRAERTAEAALRGRRARRPAGP